tara:strand:- start:1162 stop:2028 length:867 start_codon:yes stop_codon:yes gene_type:complete
MTTTIQQRTIYKNQDQFFIVLKKTPKTIATIEVEVWGMSERPSLRRINAKVYKTTDGVNGAFNISKRAKTDLNEDVEFAYLNLSPFGFGKKKVLLSADYILEGWEDTIDNNIETLERNFKNDKWIIAEEDSETDFEDMEEAQPRRMTFEEYCETDESKALDIEETKHIDNCQAIGRLANEKKAKGEEYDFKEHMREENRRHKNAREEIYNKLPDGDMEEAHIRYVDSDYNKLMNEEDEYHQDRVKCINEMSKHREEKGWEHKLWWNVEMVKELRRHENAREEIYKQLP